MKNVTVKMPESQKNLVEEMAEKKHYPNISEYIREAVRDKIEDQLKISQEVKERIEEIESREAQEGKRISTSELKQELGIE